MKAKKNPKPAPKKAYRKSISGIRIPEADHQVTISLFTLCPQKWVIVDTESGYVYSKKDNEERWYGPSLETLKDAQECIKRTIARKFPNEE